MACRPKDWAQLNHNQKKNRHNSIDKQRNIVSNKDINVVVNLSDRPLTVLETSILNKGLNFCITSNKPHFYSKNITKEVDNITRKLQIKLMFKDSDKSKVVDKFTSNPSFQPPTSTRNIAIDGFGRYLKHNIKNLVVKNKTRQNISNIERQALMKLREDKTIVINKADKGSGIVVMNTSCYLRKIHTMLQDLTTYSIILNVDLDSAKTKADKIFIKLCDEGFISNRQKNHLVRFKPKLPIFYGLGKIHKKDCPLRPIVSQIDSPTYNLSKFLDYLLTTAEKSISNLLQDTTKFLQYVELLPPTSVDTILFTIDVVSLYTVLPHDMCIKYVTEMYDDTLKYWCNFTPELHPIPTSAIGNMLSIILSQTFFQFDNITYLQKLGITMGSSCSVKVANITLHKHLVNILKTYTGVLPDIQLRLIDDIFGTFTGPETELLEFVAFLNNAHDTIKFTIEFSKKELSFLDTMVYIDKNTIKTKLYTKPTDTKQYLSCNSEHAQHMKTAIPYAQALRYRRIIMDDDILNNELDNLFTNFTARLYPPNIVLNAIEKVKHLDRNNLILYKQKNNRPWNYTACVFTFNNALTNNNNNNIYKLLSEAWQQLIITAPELTDLNLPKVVFKKCRSIKNVLVSSVFPPSRWSRRSSPPNNLHQNNDVVIIMNPANKYKCTGCYRLNCMNCTILQIGNTFTSTNLGTVFELQSNMNCNSANIVYLITCLKCRIQYVGETYRKLKDRITDHRSRIKTHKPTPIAIHFNSNNHNVLDMKVIPIEQFDTNNHRLRKERELFWQLTLKTIFPYGLNAYPIHNIDFSNVIITQPEDLLALWSLYTLQLE